MPAVPRWGTGARPTLNPPDYGEGLDMPHPWAKYTLTAVAPAGTTQVKVEFMSTGTGSIWYENAVLSEQVTSVPPLASATTLPFTVHAGHPCRPARPMTSPASPTTATGTFTLQFVGTTGVAYYVQTTTNLLPPGPGRAMVGSTNTVTSTRRDLEPRRHQRRSTAVLPVGRHRTLNPGIVPGSILTCGHTRGDKGLERPHPAVTRP